MPTPASRLVGSVLTVPRIVPTTKPYQLRRSVMMAVESIDGHGICSTSSQIIAVPGKLLNLRATSTWAQGVRGSNPRAPTILHSRPAEGSDRKGFCMWE